MIIRTDLTDHYLSAVVASNNNQRTHIEPRKIQRRDMSRFLTENFNYDVEQFVDRFIENLTEITTDNFNTVFDYFTKTYKRILDQHASVKPMSRKKTTSP